MANQEHQAIFQQGVEVWNQWRKEHRDIRPDLSGIDFTSAHLNDVRLSFSQLKEVCFRDTQLQHAYLWSCIPGEPDVEKLACPILEETVGNVSQDNALAVYFIHTRGRVSGMKVKSNIKI